MEKVNRNISPTPHNNLDDSDSDDDYGRDEKGKQGKLKCNRQRLAEKIE